MHKIDGIPSFCVHPSSCGFTPELCLRPDGYQQLLTLLSENHRDVPPYVNARMIAREKVTWVLLALSFRIFRPVKMEQVLTGQCWKASHQGVVTRRESAFFDQEGELVLASASFMTQMDTVARKICRERAQKDTMPLPKGPELFSCSSRIPFEPGTGSFLGKRTVRESWIDMLGHMNNARYGELIYDHMGSSWRSRIGELSQMDIYFLHELRPGDTIALYARETRDCLEFSGLKDPEQSPVFGARLLFENPRI